MEQSSFKNFLCSIIQWTCLVSFPVQGWAWVELWKFFFNWKSLELPFLFLKVSHLCNVYIVRWNLSNSDFQVSGWLYQLAKPFLSSLFGQILQKGQILSQAPALVRESPRSHEGCYSCIFLESIHKTVLMWFPLNVMSTVMLEIIVTKLSSCSCRGKMGEHFIRGSWEARLSLNLISSASAFQVTGITGIWP